MLTPLFSSWVLFDARAQANSASSSHRSVVESIEFDININILARSDGFFDRLDKCLCLFITAPHYKQKPDDPRVWMEISIEERKIFTASFGARFK